MKILLLGWFLSISVIAYGQNQAKFVDATESAGLKSIGSNYGASFGDFDNDGDDDLYVSTRDFQRNLFYENLGNGKFEEASTKYGLEYVGSTNGSLWFDFDNDGFLDLFVGNRDKGNLLYKNISGSTFIDISIESGVGAIPGPVSINAADVDNDGFIDLYLANANAENALYRNNGDGTFTDITQMSGATDQLISMGTVFLDYDNDLDPDLYLTHDALQANILYENDGKGNFENVAASAGVNFQGFGMGVDLADFNQDGFKDIYVTNLHENFLFINNRDKAFVEVGKSAGVDDYGMGWGVICFDFDNDGLQDIYAVNNFFYSPYSNILYRNEGGITFTTMSDNSALESPYAGFGAACSDIDNDGDIDIFVANSDNQGGNQLFVNESKVGNWIKIKVQGTLSNRMGVGALVQLHLNGKIFAEEITAGSGYISQNSLVAHFGLGDANEVDKLTILWPSGITDTYHDLEKNQFYEAIENNGIEIFKPSQSGESNDIGVVTGIEDDTSTFVDFKVYPNPTISTMTVEFQNLKNQRLKIYLSDLMGRNSVVMADRMFAPGQTELNLELDESITSGVYLLHLIGNEQKLFMKVIIGD